LESAAAALLGAVVGGFLTLAATLFVELRRDRRRQIASARLIAAELSRSAVELVTLSDRLDSEETWLDGPHPEIDCETWRREAAYFVGLLRRDEFGFVDAAARGAHLAGTASIAARPIRSLSESPKPRESSSRSPSHDGRTATSGGSSGDRQRSSRSRSASFRSSGSPPF
jgi:hypothetical protein